MRRFVLLLLLVCYPTTPAFAWGELGHQIIALVATRLVKNESFRRFLDRNEGKLGYLANVPDIWWRDLPSHDKGGETSHFLNPQDTPIPIEELPTNWKEFVKKVGGKEGDVAVEIGSLWWRADQFQRRAIADGKDAKKQSPESEAYSDAIFRMLTNMGLLGHFPADASQPFHNHSDYDGYRAGHGGIHAYYETAIPEALNDGFGLAAKVLAKAKELASTNDPLVKKKETLLEKMKRLSIWSSAQMPAMLELDKITEPSDAEKKKKAKRPFAEEVASTFEPFIVEQLARSAIVLAQAWDTIYEQAGKPNVDRYHSYRWPHTPDYVPPDYFKPSAKSAKCDPKKLAPRGKRS